MGPSRRLMPFFSDYSSFHRTKGNQRCHYFGITMITVSLLGLLSRICILARSADSDFRLDGGTLLLVFAAARYIYLDFRIGSAFTLCLMGLYFFGNLIAVPLLWVLFLGGWALQFYGHLHYEKNRPALTQNLEHILMGPLWIFGKIIRYP